MFIGRPVPRKEGRAKVVGAARYVDDLTLPGMLHARAVRPAVERHALVPKRRPDVVNVRDGVVGRVLGEIGVAAQRLAAPRDDRRIEDVTENRRRVGVPGR